MQDGSYLAEFLLEKGYDVHGIIRRASSFNTARIQHLYEDPKCHRQGKMKLHYGDMTDSSSLIKVISAVQPTEIYNLAAQSHVMVCVMLNIMFIYLLKIFISYMYKLEEVYNICCFTSLQVSFEVSEYTAEVDAVGTVRLLDAIRTCGLEKSVRFYHASTSELYGNVVEVPQNEKTSFYPRSPYGNQYIHKILCMY